MRARLVSLEGVEDIPVDRAVLLVGRHPRCDARIDSPRVSQLHCCLSRHRDEIAVRDLGSTNGTWINGRRTESGRLRSGDELSIACLRYRPEIGPTATIPMAPDDPHQCRGLSSSRGVAPPAPRGFPAARGRA